ncbi:MAG: GAF domain-containing protein [Anaerolineaceae bacterium]|nr:GAF domain-containing protein [Anaerolineaceae bacterium]
MTKRRLSVLIAIPLLLGFFNTPGRAVAESLPAPSIQEGVFAAEIEPGILRFEHLEVVEGLSENTILAIFQDHQGFLWFGTREGLNKFNGYDFTIYKADPNDPDSLSDSWITDIAETADGALWVGTYYGGLNRFDPVRGTFEHFLPDEEAADALPGERVNDLFMDSEGVLWVGTRNGLSRLNPDGLGFSTFTHDPDDNKSISNNNVLSIYEDQTGRLWVGTEDGLNLLDRSTGAFRSFLKGDPEGGSEVYAIADAEEGELWVGTHDGLVSFNTLNFVYQTFHARPEDPESLGSDLVNDLYIDRSGNLWIALDDAGVNLLLQNEGYRIKVARYPHEEYDSNSLSHNSVHVIFEDAGGLLWFGTNSGANKANPATHNFGLIQNNPDDPNSPAANDITALAYDPVGNFLWIGTAEDGLDRVDLVSGEFTHFKHVPGDENSLESDQISLLHVGKFGTVYVETKGGSLEVFDALHQRFLPLLDRSSDELGSVTTTAITHDAQGRLWISQDNGELMQLSAAGGVMGIYRLTQSVAFLNPDTRITDIYVDESGMVWLGTDAQGFVRFNPSEWLYTQYTMDGTSAGPSQNNINVIFGDRDGKLWLGTAGGGLNQYDPVSEQFVYYTADDGLPSNRIMGIMDDEAGNLWLSTANGLARFDPLTGDIHTYETRDGLQGLNFNRKSFTGLDDGMLLFGGTSGLNAFYPESIRLNDHIPPVVITSVSLFNEVLATDISDCSASLSLTYDQNFLSFDFAALDYAAPDKNQYAYILEGLNEEWVQAGNRRYAEYPNLAWGTYIFRLLGSNNDGVWNDTGACLMVDIEPPFWARWWFITGVGLALGVAVVFGYSWRLRNIEDQRKKLIEQVYERTQEIERRRLMASGLSEVIRLLNTDQPLGKSLEFITRQAVGLTAASKAAVFKRQADRIVVEASYPLGETGTLDLTDPDSPNARSLLESVFLNRMLIYSRIDSTTMQSNPNWELVSGEYRTVICVPLLIEEVVYGGLVLYYGEDRVFSPEEINLANTLADQASLAIANDRLRTNVKDVAVAAERNRLARDLHDAVTQTLFSTSLIADVLPKIWRKNPDEGQRRLAELGQLTKGALGEMRTLLIELRPSTLRDADPVELFKHLTDAFSGRTGVIVDFRVEKSDECTLPVEVKDTFYRIAQEGLNNIFKHAQADRVCFCFTCTQETVLLTIQDDGQGFDRAEVPAGHLGMGIMTERAEAIGASLSLESQPGAGTLLRLEWHFSQNTIK